MKGIPVHRVMALNAKAGFPSTINPVTAETSRRRVPTSGKAQTSERTATPGKDPISGRARASNPREDPTSKSLTQEEVILKKLPVTKRDLTQDEALISGSLIQERVTSESLQISIRELIRERALTGKALISKSLIRERVTSENHQISKRDLILEKALISRREETSKRILVSERILKREVRDQISKRTSGKNLISESLHLHQSVRIVLARGVRRASHPLTKL